MIDPLWRRAPLLLRSYPAAALALLLAAMVLAAVASSGPAFLASAGDAALQDELATQSGNRSGVALTTGGSADLMKLVAADRAVRTRLAEVPGLTEPKITVTSVRVGGFSPTLATGPDGTGEIWLVSRTGALEALVPVTVDGAPTTGDPSADGVWVPQPLGQQIGAKDGGKLLLTRADQKVVVPIAGFYRVPQAEDADGYWTTVSSQLGPHFTINKSLADGIGSLVPSPIFMTPEQVATLSRKLEVDVDVSWETGVETDGMTLAGAQDLLDHYAALDADLADAETPVARALTQLKGQKTAIKSRSTMTATVSQARATVEALRPALRTLNLMGTALGLALVAAAAVVLIRRRSTETRMLEAQGVGITARALRSGVETLPAILVGGVLGWAIGLVVIAAVPPVLPLARQTVEDAAVTTAWALLVAALTVMAATAWAAARPETLVPRRVRSAPVPWEVGLILLAALAGYELVQRGADADASGDLLTLAFPLLLLAGVSALGARMLTSAAAFPVRLTRRWPFSAYLAARRVAGGAASTRLLVAVVAVATGMAVYGTVLVASSRDALQEKALVANGAPVNATLATGMDATCSLDPPTRSWQFVVSAGEAISVCPSWHPSAEDANKQVTVTVFPAGIDPADLPKDATLVVTADVLARPSPYRVQLLLVDPVTYARVTGSTEISTLISEPTKATSPSLPGVVATPTGGRGLPELVSVELAGTLTRMRLTEQDAIPGMSGDGSTIIVDASRFLAASMPQVFGDASGYLKLFDNAAWSTGTPESLEGALLTLGAPVSDITTTDDVLSRPGFRAQDWSLAYLQVLAASAAALAIGALLLNLAERQRSRSLAAAMVRRMGATRRSMRVSISLELLALLGAGTVLGLVIGIGAGAFVASSVDPLSGSAPPRGVVVPPMLPVVVIGLALLVGAGASLFLARVTERADVARLMRVVD